MYNKCLRDEKGLGMEVIERCLQRICDVAHIYIA